MTVLWEKSNLKSNRFDAAFLSYLVANRCQKMASVNTMMTLARQFNHAYTSPYSFSSIGVVHKLYLLPSFLAVFFANYLASISGT